VKIADFGVSQAEHLTRLTVTGTVVGTPSFMSPEQARGEVLDPRSDLFSAGTVLYELLAGANPFTADSIAATLRKVVDQEPEAPSSFDPTLPVPIDGLLRKLQAKDRQRRIASAEEAGEAIRSLLDSEGVTAPAALFRTFVNDPVGFTAEYRRKKAAASAETAEKLLGNSAAPPEAALWAAYQTISCAPEDGAAKELYRTAATRAGQRESPVNNPRIRELEEQLRRDPDNPATLLQLGKLYRLEKDFVNVMRFFQRLKSVAPKDPYTQGQIAALVGGAPRPAPERGSLAAAPPPVAGESHDSGLAGKVLLALAAAALVGGVFLARGPAGRLGSPGPEEKARAAEVAHRLQSSSAPVAEGSPGSVPSRQGGGTERELLEKAALMEKEEGPAAALLFVRAALQRVSLPAGRTALLLTVADLAERTGDRAGALSALDEAASLGVSRADALFQKGILLERAGEDRVAADLFDALTQAADAGIARRATLHLAMIVDRSGDGTRALTLYEGIIAKSPATPEAIPARLGAAALYRASHRRADARKLYEEVRAAASPGSDEEKSALAGLKSLE
jgi:tetratricopeptide (TPR) repeat protein